MGPEEIGAETFLFHKGDARGETSAASALPAPEGEKDDQASAGMAELTPPPPARAPMTFEEAMEKAMKEKRTASPSDHFERGTQPGRGGDLFAVHWPSKYLVEVYLQVPIVLLVRRVPFGAHFGARQVVVCTQPASRAHASAHSPATSAHSL